MNRRGFTKLLVSALLLIATDTMGQSREGGIGPGPGAAPLVWHRYTVKGEEFSVQLPTVPAMMTNKVSRRGDGKPRLERHLATSLDGVFYSIEVFENPKPRQLLEEFIGEKNVNFRPDPATERSLTVDGFAGKEYSSRNKTPPAMVQFFATEKRLFRFLASGPGVDGPVVKEFFASIRLGKKVEGIEVSDGPGIPLQRETGERVFMGRELDAKARLLSKPEPSYTERARSNRVAGVVVLRAVFAASGRVENIRVLSGLPDGLTEQAIEAAKRIKFIPAIKDGRYVSMWMQLEYHFMP